MDPTALFEQLFGGGAFEHIFGKIDLMSMAADQDPNSPEMADLSIEEQELKSCEVYIPFLSSSLFLFLFLFLFLSFFLSSFLPYFSPEITKSNHNNAKNKK